MNHVGLGCSETSREGLKGWILKEGGGVLSEMSTNKMLEEIFLLPTVEAFRKGRLEVEVFRGAGVKQGIELLENLTVVGLPDGERFILQVEEAQLAKIFDEGDVTPDIIIEHFWNVEPGTGEELGHREKVRVIGALQGVVNSNEVLVALWFDTDDGASGGALDDRLHEDSVGGV